MVLAYKAKSSEAWAVKDTWGQVPFVFYILLTSI